MALSLGFLALSSSQSTLKQFQKALNFSDKTTFYSLLVQGYENTLHYNSKQGIFSINIDKSLQISVFFKNRISHYYELFFK